MASPERRPAEYAISFRATERGQKPSPEEWEAMRQEIHRLREEAMIAQEQMTESFYCVLDDRELTQPQRAKLAELFRPFPTRPLQSFVYVDVPESLLVGAEQAVTLERVYSLVAEAGIPAESLVRERLHRWVLKDLSKKQRDAMSALLFARLNDTPSLPLTGVRLGPDPVDIHAHTHRVVISYDVARRLTKAQFDALLRGSKEPEQC